MGKQNLKRPLLPTPPDRRDYHKLIRHSQFDDCWIIPGIPLIKPSRILTQFGREQYDLSTDVYKAIDSGSTDKLLSEDVFNHDLDFSNYAAKFQHLLFCEESEEQIQMKKYSLDAARLEREGQYLILAVEGLAEGRPSLVCGDKVLLQSPVDRSLYYEGFIHKVQLKTT